MYVPGSEQVLDVLLHVIEHLPRLSRKGAIAAQREDDVRSTAPLREEISAWFLKLYLMPGGTYLLRSVRHAPRFDAAQCYDISIYNANFLVFGAKAGEI